MTNDSEMPPELRDYIRKMEEVFGYDLPAREGEIFERARQWLLRDPPDGENQGVTRQGRPCIAKPPLSAVGGWR